MEVKEGVEKISEGRSADGWEGWFGVGDDGLDMIRYDRPCLCWEI